MNPTHVLKHNKMKTYEVRVRHKELGYYSFYTIRAYNSTDAEKLAKRKFSQDFSNNRVKSEQLDAYTINNPDKLDEIMPYMDEINANK